MMGNEKMKWLFFEMTDGVIYRVVFDSSTTRKIYIPWFKQPHQFHDSGIFTGISDAESSQVTCSFDQEVPKCHICFESVTHFLIDSGQAPSSVLAE